MDDETSRFLAELAEDQQRGVLATILLRVKANAGSVNAQYAIGRTLMYGTGLLAPDNTAARFWLQRALVGGHPGAARLLEIIRREARAKEQTN